MASRRWTMNDLLVILPGITGSVLKRRGVAVWAPAPTMLVSYIRSLGNAIEWLRLKRDDADLDDGIEATDLVPYTLVPGLYRFDGYTGLKAHLFEHFDLVEGDATNDGRPSNYFEFPYDWRRDNRVSAQRLRLLIERELPKWRRHRDDPHAKVIFVAHSMGGLVARYYIEALRGYERTKALITFGTPHRGAAKVIDYFVHGYRQFGIELGGFTAALTSMTSMYQLLPRYRAVHDADGEWKRVFDTARDLPRLDRAKARHALTIYDEIDRQYAINRNDPAYEVEMLPMVGWGHETIQSATVQQNGAVDVSSEELPPDVDSVFANGDGTVPRVSAVPIELNDKPLRWWPLNQRHATMQNNKEMLANLAQVLAAMQGHLQAPARALRGEIEHGLGLEVDDAAAAGNPIRVVVTLHSEEDPRRVVAHVEGVGAEPAAPAREVLLAYDGRAWTGEIVGLIPATYRLAIRLDNPAAGPRDPVTDVFEVV